MAGADHPAGSCAYVHAAVIGPLREDFIHYYVRQGLRELGWTLLAGQYPSGSDDELPCLNIVDPALARDRSPDHRRHSSNKLVPDLLALLDAVLLVIEMKPIYDLQDELKLLDIVGPRRPDFDRALDRLVLARGLLLPRAGSFRLQPCLGFTAGFLFPRRPDFCYLTVDQSGAMTIDGAGPAPTGQVTA